MSRNVARASEIAPVENAAGLRRTLMVDAVGCAGSALLLLILADRLSPYLGLSPDFLRGAGIVLIPFVALVLAAASRRLLSPPLVGAVVAFNVVWVLASLGVLIVGAVSPTDLGDGLILVQAVVVAIMGWQEWAELRRLTGDAVTA